MKDKIFMLVIGILVGAIITSSAFLIFGGKKGKKDFDPSKFRDGNMTPPSFSRDRKDFDSNNTNTNSIPENPAEN